MKFGLLYEAQRPFRRNRHRLEQALQGDARAVRAGRPGRLRQPVVRGASLPHRVLGLAVPRGAAGRAEPDDPADPDRLRRLHPSRSPPRSRGRARGHAGPADRRPARVRDRTLQRLRADRAGHRPAEHARDVGRVDHDDPAHLAVGRVLLGRASSGTCPRATCCPSPSRSRTRPCTWPARRPRATTWRPRRASACCRRRRSPRTSWPSTSSATGRASARTTPVGAVDQRVLGQQRPRLLRRRTTARRATLAALSLKTFFGPDKPYIRDRVNAYEQLLESWGGVPDHLKADFGRWLRQSDDAHKEQAAQVGISLDSGPGAARGVRPDGSPTPCATAASSSPATRTAASAACSLYEEAGVDQVILIMQTETIPHERALAPSRCSASTSSPRTALAPEPRRSLRERSRTQTRRLPWRP